MKRIESVVKWGILCVGAVAIIAFAATMGKAVVQVVSGLAVAQTNTRWNNVKDAAAGDNLANGIAAFSMYINDGSTFDAITGDITNGLDVDVTRIVPGTGATALGKAEDAVHATGDTGVMGLAVRNDTLAALAGTDGDYTPLQVDALGALFTATTELDGGTADVISHSFTQATTGITTNAAGTTVTMATTPMSKHNMIIDRTAGATNTVEVDLECSLNGAIWVQIATITDLTNEPALASQDGTACSSMRYNVVTVGAGNTLTIQLLGVR